MSLPAGSILAAAAIVSAHLLVPASAEAMVEPGLPGRCAPTTNMAGVGWNGVSFCATGERGAGGAAPIPNTGGAAPIPGTGRPGETIVIKDTPAEEPFEPCRELAHCLPGEGRGTAIPGRDTQWDRDRPRPTGPRSTSAPAKPPKQAFRQESEGRCRRILTLLESKVYREAPLLWVGIQELDDPSLADEPFPKLVQAHYDRMKELLEQWRERGCGPLLGKKLPPEYSRIPI